MTLFCRSWRANASRGCAFEIHARQTGTKEEEKIFRRCSAMEKQLICLCRRMFDEIVGRFHGEGNCKQRRAPMFDGPIPTMHSWRNSANDQTDGDWRETISAARRRIAADLVLREYFGADRDRREFVMRTRAVRRLHRNVNGKHSSLR